MTKALRFAIILSSLLLQGCTDSIQSKLGLYKASPDEFTVTSNEALIMPPTFDLKLQDKEATADMQEEHLTRTERAVLSRLEKARTVSQKSKIKSSIDAEFAEGKKPGKWKVKKMLDNLQQNSNKDAIDPGLEKQRIENNQNSGQPLDHGQIPSKKDDKSTLEKIFG